MPPDAPPLSSDADAPAMRAAPTSWLHAAWGALWGEEKLLLGAGLAAAIVCLSTGTGFDLEVANGYAGMIWDNVLLLLVGSRLWLWWRAKRPAPGAYYNRLHLSHELALLRTTAFLFAYLTIYTNVKTRIPLLNPSTHDWSLRMFERALLGGFDVEEWFWGLQAYQPLVDLLDRTYHHGYIFMTITTLLLFMNHGQRPLRHLVVTMGILYLLGVTVTAFWPTLGPCFFERGHYDWMKGTDSWSSQGALLKAFKSAVAARDLGAPFEAKAFMGIAALPSLHVGHCLVLSLFAWKYHRWMLWAFIPTTILTWMATLVFGWHYWLDGFASIPLIALSWWGAKRAIWGDEPWAPIDPQPSR